MKADRCYRDQTPQELKALVQHVADAAAGLLRAQATAFRCLARDLLVICPGCGALFLRLGKKRFCRARCQKRAYMRRRRAAARRDITRIVVTGADSNPVSTTADGEA